MPANFNCMKNLFDKAAYDEITVRINKLTPQSQRQWGKMEVAQMLAHCKEIFKVPLSSKPIPRSLLGLLAGWAVKHKLHNDVPWKKGLPTAPNFIIKDQRDFDTEKTGLTNLIDKFRQANPAVVEKIVHPMFGKFTGEQWGKAMYKHLDHHLRQFGA